MRDVVWGSVVLLLALVVCTWWLAALAAEPNWSEIALAVGTAVLAVATAGLALAAFLALRLRLLCRGLLGAGAGGG